MNRNVSQLIKRIKDEYPRVPSGTSLKKALAELNRLNVGALIVTKEGRPIGIFSERDLLTAVSLHGSVQFESEVDRYMSRNIVYVTPSYRLEECMAIMSIRHIRHLPVINESGIPVALLSMRHIMEALIEDKQFLIEELMRYVGADSPKPVLAHRPKVLEWTG